MTQAVKLWRRALAHAHSQLEDSADDEGALFLDDWSWEIIYGSDWQSLPPVTHESKEERPAK